MTTTLRATSPFSSAVIASFTSIQGIGPGNHFVQFEATVPVVLDQSGHVDMRTAGSRSLSGIRSAILDL